MFTALSTVALATVKVPNVVSPIIKAIAGPMQALMLFLVIAGVAIGFAHGMHDSRGQESAFVAAGRWVIYLILGIAVVMVLFNVVMPAVIPGS